LSAASYPTMTARVTSNGSLRGCSSTDVVVDNVERGLTEVYIGRVTHDGRRRSPQEWLLWRLRQAARAGLIELLPLVPPLPALPDKCATAIVECHQGLGLLLRIRQLTALSAEAEFGFAFRFAGEWSGITRDQAKDGIEGLLRHGVLVKTGKTTSTKRPMNMYRVGDGNKRSIHKAASDR
jgi:hypothetical protein